MINEFFQFNFGRIDRARYILSIEFLILASLVKTGSPPAVLSAPRDGSEDSEAIVEVRVSAEFSCLV